ncbi:MAG TPA: ABC transporter permease subunit [Candidatus Dormibacteraeota bacterium]|jgi:ABC-2 type transport system permease protein
MNNAVAIARKELKVYFSSPLFYVITALFVLVTGLFFALTILSPNATGNQTDNLRSTFNTTLFVMIFLAPLLTMRLISQEKQEGTMELLMTQPVTDTEVVLGKYLASLAMFGAMFVTTLLQVLVLMIAAVDKHKLLFINIGDIDTSTLIAGYIGNILILGGYLSLGLLASALTNNQIIAALISFVLLLSLLVVDTAAQFAQPPVSDFLSHVGPRSHADAFARGLVTAPDVIYAVSMIALPLFLTVVVLGARRWR